MMHTPITDTPRKQLVERYCEGFRRGDHAMVLGCLTDDVVWDLPGFRHLRGKAEFDGEIENPAFTGHPTLHVDRLVEEGDTVVAIGDGMALHADGTPHAFAFCDAFTFRGDLIERVESYVVALASPDVSP
jgi:ketosteroid isomerase-like protein